MKNLMDRIYKAVERQCSQSTVDRSRGGYRSSPEIDSGAQALPRQCKKEEKAVGNLTVTPVLGGAETE
jgi:hypothetical protein